MYKKLFVITVAFSAAACNGVQPENEDGSQGTTEEALSDSCANASPDARFTGGIDGVFSSPQTYNRCTKSYVVQIDDLSAEFSGDGDYGGFVISWADSLPNTQAGCEDLHGGAIIFQKIGDSWIDISGGQISSDGEWVGVVGDLDLGCFGPLMEYRGLEAGQSYKIAATMRLNSGSNPTRKVGFETRPVGIVR